MQESVATKSDAAAAMPTFSQRALVDALAKGDICIERGMLSVSALSAWVRDEVACQIATVR